jgi:hypothetical protein
LFASRRLGYLACCKSLGTGAEEAVLPSPLRLRFFASGSSETITEVGGGYTVASVDDKACERWKGESGFEVESTSVVSSLAGNTFYNPIF